MRRVRRFHVAALVAGVVGLAPSAWAQLSVGGNLGVIFDASDDRLVIGADARMPVGQTQWVFNPRLSYTPGDGFSSLQLDGNFLYMFQAPAAARVSSYAGVGALFRKDSFDSPTVDGETNVGYNLVSGLMFKTSGRLKPYVHAQYSVIQEYPNGFVTFVGAMFTVGGRGAPRAAPGRVGR